MIVKLLTEHHLGLLSLKGGCRGSSEFTHVCQNATLLEISCHGSFISYHSKAGRYNITSLVFSVVGL